MASTDWAAIVVLAGMEYVAWNECRRFGLTCFLPQRRRHVLPKGATTTLLRAEALIPCRLLMKLSESRDRAMHHARGVASPNYLVQAAGKPFTVSDAEVRALAQLDYDGAFDQPLGGNATRLEGCELLAAICPAIAEAFRPLFPKYQVSNWRPLTKAELLEAGRPSPDLRVSPWVAPLSAAASRDVIERNADDRSTAQRAADGAKGYAAVIVAKGPRPRYTFGSQATARPT
jgi:hypothetical protein